MIFTCCRYTRRGRGGIGSAPCGPSLTGLVGPRVEAQSRNNEMNREMRRKERAERELKQLKADISNKVNIVYTHPAKAGFDQCTHTQRSTI